MYHVGQKVEYVGVVPSSGVDTKPRCNCNPGIVWPKVGDRGTIVDMLIHTWEGKKILCLKIAEFPEDGCDHYFDGWDATGWRPIIEKETDISVFTEILKTSKIKESV